ncbi:AAA family ATPase [Myxococcota bacterium]|nr:AAA family ATPase [Myxococcota bacterium]
MSSQSEHAPKPEIRGTPLAAAQLRYTCDAALCAPRPEPMPVAPRDLPGIFAQARALEALHLGLEIPSPGYNIFVSGEGGTGRMSAVKDVLDELRTRVTPRLRDRVYVHDFDDPSRPRLLTLPSGRGAQLKKAMDELVRVAATQLVSLFDSEPFRAERSRLEKKFRTHEERAFGDLQRALTADGLTLGVMGEGPGAVTDVVVLLDDKPTSISALRVDPDARTAFAAAKGLFAEFPDATLEDLDPKIDAAIDELQKRYDHHHDRLAGILRESRRLARTVEKEIDELEVSRAKLVVGELIAEVKSDLPEREIHEWLDLVERHMLSNLDVFVSEDEDEDEDGEEAAAPTAARGECPDGDPRWMYEVNVVLDTSGVTVAPVVIESNPTFINLFGAYEREGEPEGPSRTDFRSIRGGSLLRADGGYLVMYARDVLLEPGVWRTLVRTLRSRLLEIRPPEPASHLSPSALKPQPIELDLKVIIIGDDELYELLTSLEEDFRKIFKIKAELATVTPLSTDSIERFVTIAHRIEDRESLLTFEPTGYAALVEHAVRLAGSKHEISTLFGEIADVMRESSHLGRVRGATSVGRAEVDRALRARRRRHDLANEDLLELLRRDILLVSTSGARVAQVNGLAVFGIGPELFGKPTRITASIGYGKSGLVNIEREVHLSGPTHDKGMLIIQGYLRNLYGSKRPLALTASLTFEQSYGEVDGDSASLAEVLALFSGFSQVPIRQSVAVTGSVNQLGDVQAVGSINEKIEGFFELCRERGLDGTQGVLIPSACIQALMLDPVVVEACTAGQFHVWAIDRVDDAIPIILGITPEELHGLVDARLEDFVGQEHEGSEITRRGNGNHRGPKGPRPPQDPRPKTPGT